MRSFSRRGFVAATGAAAAAAVVNPQTAGAVAPADAFTPTRVKLSAGTEDLPYSDRQDFADADQGFIAALVPGVVKNAAGAVVWDADAYAFVTGPDPKSVDRSLWRQSKLVAKQGLYKVADRIYQVRGLDLSNMTLIEGDTGVIVIDPLISQETAAAALDLYQQHRGPKAVTGLIYTHAHVDHFGGCMGVLPNGAGSVPVIAPDGFLEHAIEENVYVGTAMARRAQYMYGIALPKSAVGQVGCGLGMAASTGTVGLIAPTVTITETGQEETVDGVLIQFQMTPGTECASEMNFLFPDLRAVCMAENATHNMHNLITLRGAEVRDAHAWAGYLTEAITLYDGKVDVAFASHHWPSFGHDEILGLLTAQRDLYAYMHDQTVRQINSGLTGTEIAETFELPPSLANVWANRGYYGSLSHNVKAIYQKYMGWFDGNPAHLWSYPPVEESERYVYTMGGADAVKRKARVFIAKGDLRFAATLLNHVVFADTDGTDTDAKELLAEVYTQLGHLVENATWRNFYLTGALELRNGPTAPTTVANAVAVQKAMSVDQLIDSIAIRLDGPRAWDVSLKIDWHMTDEGKYYHLTLANGVLTHTVDTTPGAEATLTMAMGKLLLLRMLGGGGMTGITLTGDTTRITTLFGLVDTPNALFDIVTP